MFQVGSAPARSARNDFIGLVRSSLGASISASLLLCSVTIASASPDANATPPDPIERQFTPTQITKLIASASGRLRSGPEDATSLKQLQSTLSIEKDALLALLRIVDRPGMTPKQQMEGLAESAAKYHMVTSTLGELKYDQPDEQGKAEQARAAMLAGHFADAETGIRQIEQAEIASVNELSAQGPERASAADEHRLKAAQARMLLGNIALLSLRYPEAAEDYEVARLLVGSAFASPPIETEPEPAASKLLRPGKPEASATPAATVARSESAPPALTRTAKLETGSNDATRAEPDPPMTQIVVKPSATEALSPQIIATLIRRGDALLGIGDVTAARLLYQRAAAAGDTRGALGLAKTYDPEVLARLGVRGMQADPAVAADWYKKALQDSDNTGTALKHANR